MSRKANQILSSYPNPCFVETGTQDGHTLQSSIDIGFQEIHSIELDPKLYKKAAQRFIHYTNVTIYEGDSKEILPKILSRVDTQITFWLDAHYFARSREYRHSGPLVYELQCIQQHKRNDHTILIDDLNRIKDFGLTRKKLIRYLQAINKNYKIFRHMINNKETKVLVANIQKVNPNSFISS